MVDFGGLGGRWWDEGGGGRLLELTVWGRWCVKMGWVSVAAGRWRAGMRVCWRRGLGGGCVRRVGGGLAVVWVGGGMVGCGSGQGWFGGWWLAWVDQLYRGCAWGVSLGWSGNMC